MADSAGAFEAQEEDFGPYWGRRRISTAEQLAQLSATENAAWKWLIDTALTSPQASAFRGHIATCLKQIRRASEAVPTFLASAEAMDVGRRKQFWVNHIRSLATLFSRNEARYLPAESEPALHYKKLQNTNPELAGAFGLAICNVKAQAMDAAYIEGIIEARAFERGPPQRDDVLAGLAAIKSETQRESHKVIEELRALTNAVSTETKSLLVKDEDARAKVTQLLESAADQVQKAIAKLKSDVDAVRAAFTKDMQLQSAVTYWTARGEECAGVWKRALGATCALAATALVMAWWRYFSFKDHAFTVKDGLHLAAFALTIGFLFWGVSVAMKIFLRNLRGWTEAAERVTMVKTYLALLAENKGPPETDRTLLLLTLFRPGGSEKDDAAPENYSQLALEALRQAARAAPGSGR